MWASGARSATQKTLAMSSQ